MFQFSQVEEQFEIRTQLRRNLPALSRRGCGGKCKEGRRHALEFGKTANEHRSVERAGESARGLAQSAAFRRDALFPTRVLSPSCTQQSGAAAHALQDAVARVKVPRVSARFWTAPVLQRFLVRRVICLVKSGFHRAPKFGSRHRNILAGVCDTGFISSLLFTAAQPGRNFR